MARSIVKGDREIIANLRRAGLSVGGQFMDVTLREALEPMKERTEENARPRRQPHSPPGGHLDQGVVIVKHGATGSLRRVYWVSFTKRARKIAHLVEFGTAPHWQPNRKIMHPGARAYPFFRPAFESTKSDVADEIGRRVWSRISGSLIGSVR